MNSALIRRRIADVRRAMASAEVSRKPLAPAPRRDPKHLVGRWALPSGAVFTVRYVDEAKGRALCGNGAYRWFVGIADLHAMLDHGQLRYLGIGGRAT